MSLQNHTSPHRQVCDRYHSDKCSTLVAQDKTFIQMEASGIKPGSGYQWLSTLPLSFGPCPFVSKTNYKQCCDITKNNCTHCSIQ